MQFIANGPEIPSELLQAHQEGQVVFFAGSGISYPAGLPTFQGLVKAIYGELGESCTPEERKAFKKKKFDSALDLLEGRIRGHGRLMRKALFKSLEVKRLTKAASSTHWALLQLARGNDDALRLVTTNFDHIFQKVLRREKWKVTTYDAPLLPVPKKSRWNGLVYLHGVLPAHIDDDHALNRLVITSGDFGLAYLTERWASRFVSEMFRNYVVCFVGYSIDDPVMRYMMDALAADRRLGETVLPAYAFASFAPDQYDAPAKEWASKHVRPILYDSSVGKQSHSALHDTLRVWAETHRDGILGKERIVVDHAIARPAESTQQDDYVGRVLWALSDESGLPAKRFANFDPAPSLDWLEPLSTTCFSASDLPRFRVLPLEPEGSSLQFSLVHRPTPYARAPWMSLAYTGAEFVQWDTVMAHLGKWLLRYLDDPALLLWLAKQGGQVNDQFAWLIESELERFSKLEAEGKTEDLEAIREKSPSSIPRPELRNLWRLLLTGRIKSPRQDTDFFRWKAQFQRDGLTLALRFQLRNLLAPKLVISKPMRWSLEAADDSSDEQLHDLVKCELVLASKNVHAIVHDVALKDALRKSYPALIEDLQRLLLDALELAQTVNLYEADEDPSHWDLPSIEPHHQNRSQNDWVVLIELLRDSWLVTLEQDLPRATSFAINWFSQAYPTFKRLALFCATQDSVASSIWLGWLVDNNAWCLWSPDFKREICRLLVLQSKKMLGKERRALETAILLGPPRNLYREGIPGEDWKRPSDHAIWLRLEMLASAKIELSRKASAKLDELRSKYPELKLYESQKEEFGHWMETSWDVEIEDVDLVDNAPLKVEDLVEWLKKPPKKDRPFRASDDWNEVCSNRLIEAAEALRKLASEDFWPIERWKTALEIWSQEQLVKESWKATESFIATLPDRILAELPHSLTWWIEKVSKELDSSEVEIVTLCDRILSIEHPTNVLNDEPVTVAINHPVGHVAQTLLNLWFRRKPNDGDKLPDDLRPLFTRLADTKVIQYRHARVLLAANAIAFFRVDRDWFTKNLLPLFSWDANEKEATLVWEGFLWSARLYRPLLLEFKEDFLKTAEYSKTLGRHGRQYPTLLMVAALERPEGFTDAEFKLAFNYLDREQLQEAAHSLIQLLESAGDQREDYWTHRISPFWQEIWPKTDSLHSEKLAETFALLTIATGKRFPEAAGLLGDWYQHLANPFFVTHQLEQSNLCKSFPEDSLRLLDSVIGDPDWPIEHLRNCLDDIIAACPGLEDDRRYRRLRLLVRKWGLDWSYLRNSSKISDRRQH